MSVAMVPVPYRYLVQSVQGPVAAMMPLQIGTSTNGMPFAMTCLGLMPASGGAPPTPHGPPQRPLDERPARGQRSAGSAAAAEAALQRGVPRLPVAVPRAPTAARGAPGAKGAAADVPDVVAAVQSLYRDELKPYGRLLRKRLGELDRAGGATAADVGMKQLRAICEACPALRVHDAEGADWAVSLPGQPDRFVDVYSSVDTYPASMWEEAEVYFQGLEAAGALLPGGRYSCAQVLASCRPPFLEGRSLGQVCHIVQLAISQRKLLGYLNGCVVPYSCSKTMTKEKCAESQQPCEAVALGHIPLATWDTVRTGLQKLLSGMSAGQRRSLPLSNIKRIFRCYFDMELSETALGYARLLDLLQDPRLSDLCEVRSYGRGYVIIPLESAAESTTTPSEASTRSPLSLATASQDPLAESLDKSGSEASSRDSSQTRRSCTLAAFGCSVRNTFIHAPAPESTGARRRTSSVPKDFEG